MTQMSRACSPRRRGPGRQHPDRHRTGAGWQTHHAGWCPPAGGTLRHRRADAGRAAGQDLGVGRGGPVPGSWWRRGPANGSYSLVRYSGYQNITPLLQPYQRVRPRRDLTPLGSLIDAWRCWWSRNLQLTIALPRFGLRQGRRTRSATRSSGNGALRHVTTGRNIKDLTKTYMDCAFLSRHH
jgi:hypothetical protein